MPIWETIALAFESIRVNKLRAVLTALGIIIGVAAVITMVALGAGAQKAVEAQIDALGPNLLTIYAGQSFSRGVASSSRVSLTLDDAKALQTDTHLITAIVPELQSQYQVGYGDKNINTTITGTSANFTSVRNFKIAFGRSFTEGDDQGRQRYAVIGAAIPDMLEANPAAMIHQTIMIRGIAFEIIGVMEPKGAQASWFNPDEQIMIPLQTARYRVFGHDRLRDIYAQMAPGTSIDQALVDLERVLRRQHKIRPGGENDFRLQNSQELLSTQQAATQVFTSLLASIAAVSLVVGGIGIMNIMLVSVTERTREIGIRKALGATRLNILLQFLVEALVLCLVGGLLGILLGWRVTVSLATSNGWNTLISASSVGLAFAFSAAVGLIFGIWPASRAAGLDPITALRYE
jgi:putative ABC transport system permease protein